MEKEKALLGLIKESPKVLESIYTDLAQPGVKKVGVALETVLEFSTSFLLPIKLLNEKFKINFTKRLNDYKDKIQDIEDKDLCQVNPQIGTPIIEKLSYTTNDEIADLFTNLLAKSSSNKTINQVHPSFIQIIERLSVDEARIVKFLKDKDSIPCVSFRAYDKPDKGFIEILKRGTQLLKHVKIIFPHNLQTYLDNLVSQGILDISHGLHKVNKQKYDELYEYLRFEQYYDQFVEKGPFNRITKHDSYYHITDFGKLFINACNSNKN